MNKLVFLIAFFFFSFMNMGVSQIINQDSLLQIIRDTSISASERQKAGLLIRANQKQLLTSQFIATVMSSVDTINEEVNFNSQKLDSLVDELITIVSDPIESVKERKKAIDSLVDINNEKTLQFLIESLNDIYFQQSYSGADNEFESYYVFKSLTRKIKGNWKLIPIIINSLDVKKTDTEILMSSILLLQILDNEEQLYVAIVNARLLKSSGYMKYNLTRISQNL